jgi:Rrf2 family iron-sulfur cluster assembly transcriptional regulator
MRLNTRGRYGLQLMTQLACHSHEPKLVGLKDVAKATGLPWRYLEQIAGPLRRAGFIQGRPGRSGGYGLVRTAEHITLREVMEATSGPLRLMDCVDKPATCERSSLCASRTMWVSLTGELRDVLNRYTLGDLAKRPCAGCRASAERARESRANAPKPGARPSRDKGPSKRRKFLHPFE